MMDISLRDIAALAIAIVLSVVIVRRAVAEEEQFCAAVYPCLNSGEVAPEFNSEGYCGDQYRALCAKEKASLMSDDLVSCQNENLKFKNSEAKNLKKIRSLRKQLRDSHS
jgi:hypothetical protein